MSDEEKLNWFRALAIMWGTPLLIVALVDFLNPDVLGSMGIGAVVAVTTVAYLMVLTWRAAYLAGRNSHDD